MTILKRVHSHKTRFHIEKMKVYNKKIDIIRSGRKTLALEITRALKVLARAPYLMPDKDIQRFIKEKSPWIESHMEIMKKKIETDAEQKENISVFTEEEIHQLADKALKVIPARVAYYAPIVGTRFGRITIRNQVSRWGSCSSKGSLSFNCLLMLTPPDVIDYVVVHELCHCKELNHSARFWDEVCRVLPDYKAPKKWLKDNGGALIQRMRESLERFSE